MNAGASDVAMRPGESKVSTGQRRSLWRWWSVVTGFIALAVLCEAVFAGAMLSGVDWARRAHSVNAMILIASALTAGVVALATLRHTRYGVKLGLTLLALTVGVLLQAALGALSAKGTNLLWIHIPLGVALFGFATRAAASTRRLRGDGVG